MTGPHARVLILGGGDGLAAREVLRYPGVRQVDIVEIDPGVLRLARNDPPLSALNGHVYEDRRVRAVTADAFQWLRGPHTPYDVVISDLPDPGITASTKLYSQEFYGLAAQVLAPDGRLAVHAGSLSSRPRVFWTVDTTLRAAGLRTVPYWVGTGGPPAPAGRRHGAWDRLTGIADGPDRTLDGTRAPSDWGFVLAGLGRLPEGAVPRDLMRAAERSRITGLAPSTLVHPRYAD
jgi:spermidine synthase